MAMNDNQSSVDPESLLKDANTVDEDCGETIVSVFENIPDGGLLPAPPHDPQAPDLPKNGMVTTTRKFSTVLFEIESRGPFKTFRFRADRPEALANYITLEEWEEVRNRFDELGQKTKWNDSALLLLVASVLSFYLIFRAVMKDVMSSVIGTPLLAVLFFVTGFFVMQVLTQKRKKDEAVEKIHSACKEFSAKFKKKWVHLEFEESDPSDKFRYHAELTFHKTIRLKEPERIPFVMDDRYYEDQD